MTPAAKLRHVAVCGACHDVPGFTPECLVCGGTGVLMEGTPWLGSWRLRLTIDPDAVRMVRKDPAERNRAKARRRAKRGRP